MEDEATILQEPWHGGSEQRWHVEFGGDDAAETIRGAMRRAAVRLSDRFDSAAPSDWQREAHKAQFMALGGANADKIPITNRASYQ